MHNCLVCRHPEIPAIDRALLSGHATLKTLGQQYRLSISALHRHRQWLRQKMAQTEARYQQQQQQETLFVYNELLEASRRALRTAQAEANTRQALQAVRESGRIMNFINKLDAPPDQDVVYRLFTTPQYLTRESFLPTDHQFIIDCRQSLADGLGFPCPELPVSPVQAAWDNWPPKQKIKPNVLASTPPGRSPARSTRPASRSSCPAWTWTQTLIPKPHRAPSAMSGGTRRAAIAKAKRLPPSLIPPRRRAPNAKKARNHRRNRAQ